MLHDENAVAVEGNLAVVQMLEHWLNEAKKGKINYGAMVMCAGPTSYAATYTGALGMEYAANSGLDDLKYRIYQGLKNRQIVAINSAATADRVMYNIAKMPGSFDFLGWLIASEMTRTREGAPAPLKVGWYMGRDGNALMDSEQRQKNFESILRPMLDLIGAVEEPRAAIDGRHVEYCSLIPVVEAYKAGEKVPKFNAPQEYRDLVNEVVMKESGQPPVVITLREAEHFPHRNSDLTQWLKFAAWLEDQGEKVVFVRDTAKAHERISGFKTCPPASEDLCVRMALYQAAKACLFVANGPAMLAVFSDVPWLLFNVVQEGAGYRANTSEGWRGCAGITPPEQFPWSKPNQRICWVKDDFELMRDAYIEYIGLPEKTKLEAAE